MSDDQADGKRYDDVDRLNEQESLDGLSPQEAIERLNPGRSLPPDAYVKTCDGCGARIGFLPLLDAYGAPKINPRTGQQRQMPVDPGPVSSGNVRVRNGTARVVTAGELTPPDELYLSHFATCPKAKEFRSGKSRKR